MKTKIFLLIITLSFSNVFALKPKSTYSLKPNKYGLMYKEYKIKTADGYTLNAWFYPAQPIPDKDTTKYYFEKKILIRPYVVEDKKKPTIIICNGDAGNMAPLFGLAYNYCTNGFNVITFDWRGFGESQSFKIDTIHALVYKEFLIDYNAIIDFTKQIKTIDADRIGLFGYSTGAFLSFAVAYQRPEIKALIVRGIFTDYISLVSNLKKIEPDKILTFPDGMDMFSPRNNWSNFHKPIFLIVGALDIRTPKENSIEILSNIKSNIRELWIVEKAAHGNIDAPEIVESDLFVKKTIRFFNENL